MFYVPEKANDIGASLVFNPFIFRSLPRTLCALALHPVFGHFLCNLLLRLIAVNFNETCEFNTPAVVAPGHSFVYTETETEALQQIKDLIDSYL